MDLNEKLAQRRREREQEAAVVRAQQAAVEAANTEFIKEEAKKRLTAEGYAVPDESHVPQAQTEARIEAEMEALLQKMVSDRWTSSENTKFGILIIAIIAFLFIWWPMSIVLAILAAIYFGGKNNKYRKELNDELNSPVEKSDQKNRDSESSSSEKG